MFIDFQMISIFITVRLEDITNINKTVNSLSTASSTFNLKVPNQKVKH